ncbi:MAG: hypothetical protein EXS06_06470 [Planctomycetaceae bacterium]|nr:hypothetical protein [Planctomycetaceae bacterium]
MIGTARSHTAGKALDGHGEPIDLVDRVGKRQRRPPPTGHLECCCYHPLFVFNPFSDAERVMLRRGNHASAKDWRRVLLPVIARYDHCQIPMESVLTTDSTHAQSPTPPVLKGERLGAVLLGGGHLRNPG